MYDVVCAEKKKLVNIWIIFSMFL